MQASSDWGSSHVIQAHIQNYNTLYLSSSPSLKQIIFLFSFLFPLTILPPFLIELALYPLHALSTPKESSARAASTFITSKPSGVSPKQSSQFLACDTLCLHLFGHSFFPFSSVPTLPLSSHMGLDWMLCVVVPNLTSAGSLSTPCPSTFFPPFSTRVMPLLKTLSPPLLLSYK